jgi:hypothetical protein
MKTYLKIMVLALALIFSCVGVTWAELLVDDNTYSRHGMQMPSVGQMQGFLAGVEPDGKWIECAGQRIPEENQELIEIYGPALPDRTGETAVVGGRTVAVRYFVRAVE